MTSHEVDRQWPGEILLDPAGAGGASLGLRRRSKLQSRCVFTIPRKYVLGWCGVLPQRLLRRLAEELRDAIGLELG